MRAYLGVILANAAILVSSDDVLVHVAPASHGRLALVADDGELLLVALLAVEIGVDVEDDDGTEVTHALLGDTQQLGTLLVELDALDGGGKLPGLEQAAGLDLPEADGVVGAAAGNHAGVRGDVDGPDGTLVALVGSEALAIVTEPGADVLILGDGEEEVAVAVEFDLRQRTFLIFFVSAENFPNRSSDRPL